jgi:iron complex outermembrane recepter protein
MVGKFTGNKLPLAALVAVTLNAPGAYSQALEEVIVTATKRAESLQDTPVAVTAYNAEALENLGVTNLAELSVQAPSLQSYDFPTASTNIALFIRGFGNTDSQTLTIDNPVGIYLDNVYVARTSGATLDILDLERVEILRGPQGTLFGRNSSAGSVNFITKKPGDELAGKVKVTGGNFGLAQVSGYIDVPVGDKLSFKLSGSAKEEDGWVENKGPNDVSPQEGSDFYAEESQGYRIAARWKASDSFTADYSYDWSKIDATAPYYQTQADERQEETTHLFLGGGAYQYVLPESQNKHYGHNLTMEWDVSENITLKSITGYREMEETSVQNWSDTLFFATDIDWETQAFSQELQLLGNAFDDKLQYIAGLYYFEEEGKKHETQFTNGAFLPDVVIMDALALPLSEVGLFSGGTNMGAAMFDTDLKSQAAFLQGTFAVTDRFDLTLGTRYTEDERDAVRDVDPQNPTINFQPGANGDEYEHWDYNVTLDYALTEAVNTYVRVATGYRAGGSAERALDFSQTFDQEENTTYEIGLKSEWADSRIRVNAALFQSDFEDLLLTISGQPPLFASFVEVFNAGEAQVQGFEMDLTALVTANTMITFNYAYLDTELSDVVVPDQSFLLGGPPASAVDLRGTDITDSTFIAFAPKHAFSVALDHSWALDFGSLDFHLNYVYRDEVFSQPGMGLPVPELGLLNGRLSLAGVEMGSTTWKVALWGKNLTDEAEEIYDLSTAGHQFNKPRSYGIDLSVEF